MRIRAIRLAECGCLRAPVALEGLSGGLDVLAGPNELGKSTVLRALRLALTEKHTSRKAEVEALRSYGGGAPLIEIDLEAQGRRWRLRKRFLAQRMAELAALDGASLLRGEDAEAHLVELIGGPGSSGRFPLLWLAQGDALAPPAIDDAGKSLLQAAVAGEAQAIAGGASLRRLGAAIGARLDELLTGHATRRPGGRFAAAQRRQKEIAARLEAANAAVARAGAALDRLGTLREREADLASPTTAARLATAEAEARSALDTAREARLRLAAARDVRTAAEQAAMAAAQNLAAFDRSVGDLEALASRQADEERAAADLASRQAAAMAAATAAREGVEAARAAAADCEAGLAAARSGERRCETETRLAGLARRLAEARGLAAEIAAKERQIEALRVTEATVAEARRLARDIEVLEARIAAGASTVTIDYLPNAAGRIRLGGRTLGDGERIASASPMVLDIDGIGRLVVSPAVLADLERHEAQLARLRGEWRALLDGAHAADLPDLEALLARRHALATERTGAAARLGGLAPLGLARLEADHDALAEACAGLPAVMAPAPSRPRIELERELDDLRRSSEAAGERAAAAAAELAAVREAIAAQASRAGERRERIETAAALLPAPDARPAHRRRLAAAAAGAEARLNEAVCGLAAWQEQAPDDAGLARLADACSAAGAARHACVRELHQTAEEAARIEGELAALRNDCAVAEVEALAAASAASGRDLARIEDEVAALQLLARCIGEAQTAVKDRYLAPLTERLAPLMEMVFPGAAVTLGLDFMPGALVRGGAAEPVDRLSDGTREQIAVLGRLAFAGLLADAGSGVPLILDDALVYSDDERLAAMFRALASGSRRHQVIVLTCRSRAFETLGGTRISLMPWLEDGGPASTAEPRVLVLRA